MVIKVLQPRFSNALNISRESSNLGRVLYVVYRDRSNKTRKNAFYFFSTFIYSLYLVRSFLFEKDIMVGVWKEIFFAVHHKNFKLNDWLLVVTNANIKMTKEEKRMKDT